MLEDSGREVAAVAERLKAFLADPRGAGPRYLEGAEPLPEGGIVLRLAQGKIPAGIGDDTLVREAAQQFVRRVCLFERANHYQVLCAARDASPDTIKENYHLLMSLLHPDRQASAAEAWPRECAQRVNLAYASLGDPEARRDYDVRLSTERARNHMPRAAPSARRRGGEVRFAKAMIAVSVVVAVLLGIGLVVHDDDWSDRSLLEASFARLREHSVAAVSRPRYVGANAFTPPRPASDAITSDEPETSGILRPLMRAIIGDEPKAPAPGARIESERVDSVAALAPAPAPDAMPGPAPLQRVGSSEGAPIVVAQNDRALRTVPADATRPGNREIENLVVTLIAYYDAGDAERLVGLVDGGFWSNNQSRNAYADFFRATKSRHLRLERLAWNATDGTLRARGEATVQAEYFDRPPFERRVDVEMDIVMRGGKARLTRLLLFPDAP